MGANRVTSYKGVFLARLEQGTAFFANLRIGYIAKVVNRDDAASMFNTAFILDTNMWPNDSDHGNKKFAFAADHSASVLRE